MHVDSVSVYLDHAVILHMSALHLIHKHVSLQENIWGKILIFLTKLTGLFSEVLWQTDLCDFCISQRQQNQSFLEFTLQTLQTVSSHFNPQTGGPKCSSLPTRSSALTFLSLFMLSSEKALSTVSFSFCGGSTSTSVLCKGRCVMNTRTRSFRV